MTFLKGLAIPWTGLLLIMLSLILVVITFVYNPCGGCSGWNIINPFCYMGVTACQLQWQPIQLIIKVGAGVLFLVGIVKLVRN